VHRAVKTKDFLLSIFININLTATYENVKHDVLSWLLTYLLTISGIARAYEYWTWYLIENSSNLKLSSIDTTLADDRRRRRSELSDRQRVGKFTMMRFRQQSLVNERCETCGPLHWRTRFRSNLKIHNQRIYVREIRGVLLDFQILSRSRDVLRFLHVRVFTASLHSKYRRVT